MKYAVRNRNNPSEWIIDKPGGRLDHWGPRIGRAEWDDPWAAKACAESARAGFLGEVVALPAKVFVVLDPMNGTYYKGPDDQSETGHAWTREVNEFARYPTRVAAEESVAVLKHGAGFDGLSITEAVEFLDNPPTWMKVELP